MKILLTLIVGCWGLLNNMSKTSQSKVLSPPIVALRSSAMSNIRTECPKCSKLIKKGQRAIHCDICDCWLYMKCAELSITDYLRLGGSDEKWYCIICLSQVLPFMSIDSNALIEEFVCSQNDFICPLCVNIRNTNCFRDNLSDDDPAINLCSQCKYYDVDELKRESCLVTNVACVHINARNVAANFSSVTKMCEVVNYAFDFIIITEAWIDKYSADFFSLPGYLLFSFPRLSKKGCGIMIFVKSCYVCSVCDVDVNVSFLNLAWLRP